MPRLNTLRISAVALLVSQTCALLLCTSIQAHARRTTDADILRIRRNAERGVIQDQIALGNAYFLGNGVPQDLFAAAQWYEKAAGSGDAFAENQVGYLYTVGMGVPKDLERAAHWFQLSSSAGLKEAKVNLAVAYIFGRGVTKNPQLAVRLFEEAGRAGDGAAYAYLGDLYYLGNGVPRDESAAEQFYNKGVALKDYLSEYRMGVILSNPPQQPRDLRKGAALLKQAANSGFVPAMHEAGLLLVNHPELKPHPDEALALLRKSAEAGNWKSSVVLGVLARDGKLVAQDARAAYFHFHVAAREGGDAALSIIKNDLLLLSHALKDDDKATLDKQVDAWVARHRQAIQFIYGEKNGAAPFHAYALGQSFNGDHAGRLIPTPQNGQEDEATSPVTQ